MLGISKMQERRYTEKNFNSIFEHNQIKNFLQYCHYNSFIVLDLDNTIVEPSQELGSDQWFEKLLDQACKISPGHETVELIVKLYHAVQHHTILQPVENKVVFLIKALQDIGIPVIALSSRGTPIITPTLVQLNRLGIHFNRQWGQLTLNFTENGIQSAAIFKSGIIFCNGYDKGKCLNTFFSAIKFYPKNVLMIDDKEKHLRSVEKMINAYSGKFAGVRYGFLDEKVTKINMENADIQLVKMQKQFLEKDKKTLESVNKLLKKKPNQFFKSEPKLLGNHVCVHSSKNHRKRSRLV